MRVLPVLALLLLAARAPAAERHVLPNGLTVILEEDHRLPRVAVVLDVGVGSADDPPGMEGLAHLAEHALFLGSPAVGKAGVSARLAAAGAWNDNGTTYPDHTEYREVVPSASLDLALWIEAQRLAFGALGVSDEGFEREKAIVDHEHRLRDSPIRSCERTVWRLLLEDGSRYRPPSGVPDVTGLDRDDVLTFLQAAYAPDDAVLVLVGDLAPAAALAGVRRVFGGIRRSAAPLPRRNALHARLAPGDDTVRVRSSHDLVLVGWLAPALYAPDDAALDLAAEVLRVRLGHALVEGSSLLASVGVRHPSGAIASLFEVMGVVSTGVDADDVPSRIADEVRKLAERPLPPEELETARSLCIDEVRAPQDVLLRAQALASYQRRLGEPDGFDRDRRRYEALTAEAVRAAVRRHLAPERAATVVGEKAR